MLADLPSPVLIKQGSVASIGAQPPKFGILLEWKKQADPRGHESWAGLVVYALPAAVHGGSWEIRMMWMDAGYLTPVGRPPVAGHDESAPPPGEG